MGCLWLQAKESEIFSGTGLIKTLKDTVTQHRNMVDDYHDVWYSEAITLAEEIEVEESLPRIYFKQFPVSDPSTYYKHFLTTAVLDYLNTDIPLRKYSIECPIENAIAR